MSRYFAGIDGGQSATVAVVGDVHGVVLGRGRAEAADEVGQGPSSTRLRDALRGALAAALRSAGLRETTGCEAIVAGVSGFDGRVRGRAPELGSQRLRILHDAPIAHAGAFALEPGILVIAGTGSVVYAGTSDHGTMRGGWGYLFGDEGSGFWFAREALAELMRAQDEGPGFERERRLVLEFFGFASLRELADAFYAGGLTRARLAACAPAILEMPAFAPLAALGARRLAAATAAAARETGLTRVALCGGLFEDARYRDEVATTVLATVPRSEIEEARYDAPRGALLLAYRDAHVALPDNRLT